MQQNLSPCLSQGVNLVKLDTSHCDWLHILLQKAYHLLSFIYSDLHIHFSTEAVLQGELALISNLFSFL